MDKGKTFSDSTTAEDKSIGFDFQYYYFLYLLLGLDEDEKIGYEVKDDIHIEKKNGKQILLQLKHSIQRKADGKIVNLTERDIDLWKTISNWIKMIKDKNDSRGELIEQISFIKNTEFIIVSNKSINSNNNFIKKVYDFKNEIINISEFREYLNELYQNTETEKENEKNVKSYIELLCLQEDNWISEFINNIEFELEITEIIQMIKNKLKKIVFDDARIDDVFECLYLNVKKNNYFSISNKEKIIITFDDFRRKYKNCFGKNLKWKLPIQEYNLPDVEIDEEICIKQIKEIESLSSEEKIEVLSNKINLESNIIDWDQNGLVTIVEVEKFHEDAIAKWKNSFKKYHRKSSEILSDTSLTEQERKEIIVNNAIECLDEIKGKELFMDEQNLGTKMSNGEFYSLSNMPKIGWVFDWEEKFKNDKK